MGNALRRGSTPKGTWILLSLLLLVAVFACEQEEIAEENSADHTPTEDQEEPIHPAFGLDESSLATLLSDLPPSTAQRIMERRRPFLDLVEEMLTTPEELLLLVDKEHPLSREYEPEDLVSLGRYEQKLILTRDDLSLRRLMMEELLEMVDAAASEGVDLPISSTYRSYEYQERLFAYWVEELGEEEALRSSARPGTSQHQLGTTIDFGSITDAFAATPGGRWLAENAWRYGFSLSYPEGYEEVTGYKYESWHYRYIGRAAAQMEQIFFGGIQQHLLEFWNDTRGAFAAAYRSRESLRREDE